VAVARVSFYAIGGSVILYFSYVLFFEKLDKEEKNKIKVIAVFFLASAMFYAGYEQQGSSLNLFASRYTDRFIGSFEFPAGWFQTVPAGAVIEISSDSFDGDKLLEVVWEGKHVMMFTQDLRMRAESANGPRK